MIPPQHRFRLEDMRDYARKAIDVSQDQDSDAEVRAFALERLITIVGEAVAKVPESVRVLAPDLPWRMIVGMRNILVHDYASSREDIVAKVVRDGLPDLIATPDRLLAETSE
jgi:Uncharacterized conserved protein